MLIREKEWMSQRISYYIATFILASFVGWAVETVYISARSGHWVDRGMMFLPFCPLYGTGAILLLFILKTPRKGIANKVHYLISGTLFLAVVQFFAGYILKYLFHHPFWDFSQEPFNLLGLISLESIAVWGILSFIYMMLVQPLFEKFVYRLPKGVLNVSVAVISVAYLTDYCYHLVRLFTNQ